MPDLTRWQPTMTRWNPFKDLEDMEKRLSTYLGQIGRASCRERVCMLV